MCYSLVVLAYIWRKWSSSLGSVSFFYKYEDPNIIAHFRFNGYFLRYVELLVCCIVNNVFVESSIDIFFMFNY